MGLLDGKVALVTGAGGGLGEAYALALAAAGARVVVNDLGGARDGSGAGEAMADQVVAKIREAGGEAVANYASVADAEGARSMVQQALDAFGRIDVVVNNAGILRDRTLLKMTEAQWDLVQAVHLKGTFLVTQVALKELVRAGQGGRIINTSSYAGLKGNFGQANYGAAKAGIAGFTRVVALEARRAGVTVNAIAPVAKTRMTDDIALVPDAYTPADIAPLIVWLASDLAADVTGRVFGAHGRHYLEYVTEMTPGVELPAGESWTPEAISARLGEITETAAERAARTSGDGPADDGEVRGLFEALPAVYTGAGWEALLVFEVKGVGRYGVQVSGGSASFVAEPKGKGAGTITFDGATTLLGLASGDLNPQQAFMAQKITTTDLGVLMKFAKHFDLARAASIMRGEDGEGDADGAAEEEAATTLADLIGKQYAGRASFARPALTRAYAEATNDANPRYVGEGADVAPPLYPVRPFMEGLNAFFHDEDTGVDLSRVLHGEQDMTFHRPVRCWDLVAQRTEIFSVEQKSSGELVRLRQRLMCEGEVVTEAISTMFIRSSTKSSTGSKKAQATADKDGVSAPTVLAEASQVVAADQSIRYAEASGDHNPIHTDPTFARAAGLPDIILHGLCTMAFASQAVVNELAGGDPARLKRLKVRFTRPVLPGWTLTTRMWVVAEEEGRTRYGLETVNQDGEVVLANAEAEVSGMSS